MVKGMQILIVKLLRFIYDNLTSCTTITESRGREKNYYKRNVLNLSIKTEDIYKKPRLSYFHTLITMYLLHMTCIKPPVTFLFPHLDNHGTSSFVTVGRLFLSLPALVTSSSMTVSRLLD